MKLRTVLGELGVAEHAEGRGVDLEEEVFAYPACNAGMSSEQLVMLAPEDRPAAPEGHLGLTLVYCGEQLPERGTCPDGRTVLCAAPGGYAAFEARFVRLPQLHAHLDLQRKRLYAAFESSYDIQRFADKAYEIIGNPLMIVNSDRRLLASAGSFPKDRADVLEEINQGYVSEEVDAELESAGILDDVRHAGHSIISENPRFGQRWVTSIISFHHMEMGRLDLLEQDRAIADADLELIDFAGSLAAIIIDKLGIAGERAGSGSTVLDDILGDSFVNEKTMRAQLALSSMPLDETYVLMQLSSTRDIPRAHLQRIASRVAHAFRSCLWTIRDGGLAVLLSLGPRTCAGWDGYDRAERILGQRKEFLNTLAQNGLRAYVCEPFEQLGFAHDRFMQILDLASAHIDDHSAIVYFWKHRYAVLASLAKTFGQVDMMLDKRVVAMSLYDDDHGTSYLETACRTVDYPGSPAEAAKALNVHRNTYFYRVNKIAELFLLDLKRGEDRLAVAFSTRCLAGMGNRVPYDMGLVPDGLRRPSERSRRD